MSVRGKFETLYLPRVGDRTIEAHSATKADAGGPHVDVREMRIRLLPVDKKMPRRRQICRLEVLIDVWQLAIAACNRGFPWKAGDAYALDRGMRRSKQDPEGTTVGQFTGDEGIKSIRITQ